MERLVIGYQRPPPTRRIRTSRLAALSLLSGVFLLPAPASTAEPTPSTSVSSKPAGEASKGTAAKDKAQGPNAVSDAVAMALFLDRLMIAESGGLDEARNPRSTAVGPFQFIESTFLSVARRHFPAETDELSAGEVLKLRTNRAFARRAAEAFTRDNAAHLAVAGFEATFANLRLAHLVGPGGAVRVLKAPASTPAASLLGGPVARANPFLANLTAGSLVAWSARNLAVSELGRKTIAADPSRVARSGAPPQKPEIQIRCNRGLASCRRWVSLAKTRLARKERIAGAVTKQQR